MIPVLVQYVFVEAKFDVITLLVRRLVSASVSDGALGNVTVNTEVLVTVATVCILLYLFAEEVAFSEPEICIF